MIPEHATQSTLEMSADEKGVLDLIIFILAILV